MNALIAKVTLAYERNSASNLGWEEYIIYYTFCVLGVFVSTCLLVSPLSRQVRFLYFSGLASVGDN